MRPLPPASEASEIAGEKESRAEQEGRTKVHLRVIVVTIVSTYVRPPPSGSALRDRVDKGGPLDKILNFVQRRPPDVKVICV